MATPKKSDSATPEPMTPEQFAAIIAAAKLNQSSAARTLGVDRRTVIRWLNGEVPISKQNAVYIRAVLKPAK